jgi:hypothetical protein
MPARLRLVKRRPSAIHCELMRLKAVVSCSLVGAALCSGCGGTTTTTVETVIKQVPATPPPATQQSQSEATAPGTTSTAVEVAQPEGVKTVPDEILLRLNVAEEDLESRNLTYKVVRRHGAIEPTARAEWTVCAMTPAPGARVRAKAVIRLSVSRFTQPRCKLFSRRLR